MSILIDNNTRVVVQGITGGEGSFHTRQMVEYGSKVVAGVTPGKGGQNVDGIPVFNWVEGKLTGYYVRRYIDSAQRFDEVPRLSERRIAAYDLLDEIADEADTHLAMSFEPGDMQFLHNHQILHDRTAFVDFDDPDERRHLLRLWLCPPGGRTLPDAFRQRWGSIEPGNRGGIVVEGAERKTPLVPE